MVASRNSVCRCITKYENRTKGSLSNKLLSTQFMRRFQHISICKLRALAIVLVAILCCCTTPPASLATLPRYKDVPQVPAGMPLGTTMTWVDGGWYPKGPSIEFQEQALRKVEEEENDGYGLGRLYHVYKLGFSHQSFKCSDSQSDIIAEVNKLNDSAAGAPYYVFVGTRY